MTAPETVELYKVAVEMADRVSSRRGQANQFFVGLQTLLLGIPASIGLATGNSGDDWARVTLAVSGVVVSAAWWLQLRSYRDLNRAKFAVINAIERDYFEIKPFTDEWATLKGDEVKRWRDRYAELGIAERFLPFTFIAIHLGVLIVSIACLST